MKLRPPDHPYRWSFGRPPRRSNKGLKGGLLRLWEPCRTDSPPPPSTHSCPADGLARPPRRHPRWGPEVSPPAAQTGTCLGLWNLRTQKRRRRPRRECAPEAQGRARGERGERSRRPPGGRRGAPPGAEPTAGHTAERTSRAQALPSAAAARGHCGGR